MRGRPGNAQDGRLLSDGALCGKLLSVVTPQHLGNTTLQIAQLSQWAAMLAGAGMFQDVLTGRIGVG
tara:strand:- start:15032 stop:15232 length:201 start_codon:yes stop_codon:yes gene_type:complete